MTCACTCKHPWAVCLFVLIGNVTFRKNAVLIYLRLKKYVTKLWVTWWNHKNSKAWWFNVTLSLAWGGGLLYLKTYRVHILCSIRGYHSHVSDENLKTCIPCQPVVYLQRAQCVHAVRSSQLKWRVTQRLRCREHQRSLNHREDFEGNQKHVWKQLQYITAICLKLAYIMMSSETLGPETSKCGDSHRAAAFSTKSWTYCTAMKEIQNNSAGGYCFTSKISWMC